MRFAGKRTIDMFGFLSLPRRLGAVAAALAVVFAPLAARAQDDLPSYARSATVSTDETIHGRIRSVDGAFTLAVDDDRGFVDNVLLHQGTIINPTGLSLTPGMSVTILGFNAGDTFDANEIDTPYTYDGPPPTPVYYGPGYWCPGFAYGYGPSFSLGIVIGGGGPWSFEHRPFRGRPWDGHRYFGAEVARGAQPRVNEHRGTEPHLVAPRVRLEQRRPVDSAPARSSDVRSNAPPAFTGRSFAGEPRGNTVTSTRRYEETRGISGGNHLERTPQTQRAPRFERGAEPVRASGAGHAGGAERAGNGAGAGGSTHGGGGGSAHAH
jgi:hypothetical protein